MIKYPERFNEATPAQFDGIFDWDFLLPAFKGTKIQPTDIDAVVERHGKFLIFETKAPGTPIPMGQTIMLEALLRLGRGCITVFVIFGKSFDTITDMEEWVLDNGRIVKRLYPDCNHYVVLQRAIQWFEWANKEGR